MIRRAPRRKVPFPHLTLPLAALAFVGLVLMAPIVLLRPLPAEAEAPASEPVRVAVLIPYVVDALQELDSPRVELVAVATPSHGSIPPGAADLGNAHSPNYERLAEVRPDLVVASGRLHGSLRDKLSRGGAEVLLVDSSSVDETFDSLQRVADRVGEGAAMARRLAEARGRLAELRLAEPVEVLPLFGAPGSFLAITGSTWLGDLLDELGFRNPVTAGAGREAFPGYVQLSDEVLVTLRPHHVLLVTHGEPEAVRESFARQAAGDGPWSRLGAQAEVLSPRLFGDNPGLRMPEAARELIRLNREAAGR